LVFTPQPIPLTQWPVQIYVFASNNFIPEPYTIKS
jgi:hypothetical protein